MEGAARRDLAGPGAEMGRPRDTAGGSWGGTEPVTGHEPVVMPKRNVNTKDTTRVLKANRGK